jgi:hypothetical protein
VVRIEFDESSEGQVNSSDPALRITNRGSGASLSAHAQSGESIRGETNSESATAVVGIKNNASAQGGGGVMGFSWSSSVGVYGFSLRGEGVRGATSSESAPAVIGIQSNDDTTSNGPGVIGQSRRGEGVRGVSYSDRYAAIAGYQLNTTRSAPGLVIGVYGECNRGIGVLGVTASDRYAAIAGIGRIAGRFEGGVEVTGTIRVLSTDCAENFDLSANVQDIEAGTVMTLNDNGDLEPCSQPYDKRVAGIISGAGGHKPALLLDKKQEEQQHETQSNAKMRMAIALMGKVYCKVDATISPIEIGDLLTTSLTEGYAMKAADFAKAFGSVIGKALEPLREGRGMIPVLVALQ